ncbi:MULTISPECIES: cupin domain-containing protein [Caballeronia]|uniref:Cupin n=1 Tax=Caballeronia cordobensis TaxID=1353886 RepID=A0A158H6P9_CABCO|nr:MULTISPECIES: cupin domain-containing protein [Caballeronia]AET90819.1 Cupin 2, conserved barrel domain protein [Burkholderia sp. YI23]AQH01925.1 cupin [Burkholderia sp. KK1]BAO88369.1 cupin 2, conserved barrel domain protein [Burkholderia sp. RPE67]BBP98903.1 cupin [Burkholderia sp. SFA1]MCE4544029.1 cupin domain-containing protein [Caballeronia sp. PC1]
MQLQTGNLFSVEAKREAQERIDVLVTGQRLNVERIVSMGHASPEGFWYDDSRAEWVVLLSGAAALEFEDGPALHEMRPGDYVLIEPHCRHRVARTQADEPSVWLAIYHER